MAHNQIISLTKVLEIEGLVMLLNDRGENTPQEIFSALDSKIQSLLDDVTNASKQFTTTASPEDTHETDDEAIARSAFEEEAQDADETTHETSLETPVSEKIVNDIESIDDEKEPEDADEPTHETSLETPASEKIVNDIESVTVEKEPEDISGQTFPGSMNDGELESAVKSVMEMLKTIQESPEVTPAEEVEAEKEEQLEEEQQQLEIEVEKTVVAEVKPLPKANFKFSLNDKYIFRRELFNFSDEEMQEALEVAADMTTIEDLEDYFYNDLCWDPENPTVKEFMSVVTARFK